MFYYNYNPTLFLYLYNARIPELTEKCNHEECISVFRSFKSYRSGELVRSNEQDKYGMGNTLYIGSLKSEVYFCIYEKDYEQYAKYDIAIEDTKIKNRFEIRLKNDRAYYAVRDLLTYHDAERTAFDIINRYIRFADKEVEKRRSEWKTNEKFIPLLSVNSAAIYLRFPVFLLHNISSTFGLISSS